MVARLTDMACRKLKPGDARLSDGGSLHLAARPGGVRTWMYRYVLDGKEGVYFIGRYPEISLAEARRARDEARKLVKEGRHPKSYRDVTVKEQIAADKRTLSYVIGLWFAEQKARPSTERKSWTAEHAHKKSLRITRYINSTVIGGLPIAEIKPAHVLELVNAVPPSQRKMVRSTIDNAFQLAISEAWVIWNPAQMIRARIVPPAITPMAAAKTIEHVRGVLAGVESRATANPIVVLCHRLMALTGLRVAEACQLRWDYVEDMTGTAPMLIIPAEAMKGRHRGHIVPLAPQVVSVLLQARRFSNGGPWIFPAVYKAGIPIGDRQIVRLLEQADTPVKHVPHGWRAAFSTLMNEAFPNDRAVIDLMLHHLPKGLSAAETAYNRSTHHARRRELACAWADMLLAEARPIGEVIGTGLVAITRAA